MRGLKGGYRKKGAISISDIDLKDMELKGEKHPVLIRFTIKNIRKLGWLVNKIPHEVSLSDIVNNAVDDYKRDELEEIRSKKIRLAQEMAALEQIELGIISKRKREQEAELNNAFKAKAE